VKSTSATRVTHRDRRVSLGLSLALYIFFVFLTRQPRGMDGLSSPPAPRSSLPPSSVPIPSNLTNGSSPRRQRQPAINGALALGDDDDESREDDGTSARRRKRFRGQIVNDVPLVKDAVGESVAESFETFLKT
jgi:DNA replication licensing factor MCM6